MKTIAIFGSCVSRDAFNSKINPSYKKHFEVLLSSHQASLVSMMAKPTDIPPELLDGASVHAKATINNDAHKTFISGLTSASPDYFLVDLRSDVSSGAAEWNGSLITPIRWHNKNTPLGKILQSSKKYRPSLQWEEYESKFHEACQKFSKLIEETWPDTKILLNGVKASSALINEDGSLIPEAFSVDTVNDYWEKLDSIFLNTMKNAEMIKLEAIANYGHPWGKASIHYETKFYKKLTESILNR